MTLAQAIERIEILEEENRQLREALLPSRQFTIFNYTKAESAILRAIAAGRGVVVPRDRILTAVFGVGHDRSDHWLDAHISHIRSKYTRHNSRLPSRTFKIRTVYGIGFSMPIEDCNAVLESVTKTVGEPCPRKPYTRRHVASFDSSELTTKETAGC